MKNASKFKKSSLAAVLTLGLFVAYHRLRQRRSGHHLAESISNDPAKVGLSKQVFEILPRWGVIANGKPIEWMNLILLGDEVAVRANLECAGWLEADDVTPWSLIKAVFAIVTHGAYPTGPMTPVFAGDDLQRLNYQKPTAQNVFSIRHHARFWTTDLLDNKKRPVWIAHASFDVAIKGQGALHFPPTHEVDPDIDTERDFLVNDLVSAGAKLRGYVQFQPAGGGTNAFDDKYHSDGRAAVLEVKA